MFFKNLIAPPRIAVKAKPSPRKSRRGYYAAAKTGRLIGDWAPLNENVNQLIGNSSASVRARVRQLVRDFPYFKRAVNLVVNYAIGDGIVFQARVTDESGSLLSKYNQEIEDAFNFWAEEADVAGKLHYYEMMALAKRQDMECGEFLLVKTQPRQATRTNYALQMYEAEWLDGTISGAGKNPVTQGVEYDRQTGAVLAYHLTDPDSWGKAARIPAARVIHKFATERPGQLRGISPLTAAVLMTHSLSEYIEAELDRAKMSAKYLGSLETSENYDLGSDGPDERTVDDKKIIDIENAIIETLSPGEKLTLTANPNPNSNMPEFVKLLLCMLAVVAEVPYELLSGNYDGFNFSSGKISRNDFAQQLKPTVTRHVRHFGLPTVRPFFDAAALSGLLKLPNYYSNSLFWQRHIWQPPGMESVDPGRDTKSMIDQINSLLRSPQEVVRARGRNFEDVLNEIAAAKKMAADRKLTPAEVSTALANNPAAIAKQK